MTFTRKPLIVILLIAAVLNLLALFGVVTAQEATPTEPVVAVTEAATPEAQSTQPAAVTPESTQPVAASTETAAPTSPQWGYSGKSGPTHWSELSADYALCGSGKAQSPIDILAPTSQSLAPIQFDYQASGLTLVNNGHTIQVNFDPGSTITLNGTSYTLQHVDLHHPSEHTINGIVYPMELDFVHADASGNLVVVALLAQEGAQDNPVFAPIFDNLPGHNNDTKTVAQGMINAGNMLPSERVYYTYSGSLTTPPCTEGVTWLVLAAPITLSPVQIAKFTHLFPLNARPVQALNGRAVTVSSGS